MAAKYTTYVLNALDFEKHPCVSGVAYVPPLGYKILYAHAVKDGICIHCGEGVFVSFETPPWRDCTNI